jgi:type II secretion system protein N
MKRAALFTVLLALFLLFTFPHDVVVRRLLLARLPADVHVTFAKVSPSLRPLGYRLSGVELSHDPFRARLDSVRVGLGWLGAVRFELVACGGTVEGSVVRGTSSEGGSSRDLVIEVTEIDPSACLDLGGPSIEGRFHGRIALVGLAAGNPRDALGKLARSVSISLAGENGVLSGYFPASRVTKPSGKRREPQPIGRWEFSRTSLEAEVEGDRLSVTRGEAEAEGVRWDTDSASIIFAGQTPRIQAELTAKRLDDSARSKAIFGLLPKAAEKDGQRRYRLSGPLSSVQITGLK